MRLIFQFSGGHEACVGVGVGVGFFFLRGCGCCALVLVFRMGAGVVCVFCSYISYGAEPGAYVQTPGQLEGLIL